MPLNAIDWMVVEGSRERGKLIVGGDLCMDNVTAHMTNWPYSYNKTQMLFEILITIGAEVIYNVKLWLNIQQMFEWHRQSSNV